MNRIVNSLLLVGIVFLGETRAEEAPKTRAWPDSAPLAQQNLVVALEGGGFARVDVLGQRLFRIRYGRSRQWTESALNRYGILAAAFPAVAFEKTEAGGLCTLATRQARLTISRKNGAIALAGSAGAPLTRQSAPAYGDGGYRLGFTLEKQERLYGLGDVSRENIMRRGGAYECWVRNVKAYIPIPVLLSNRGWGLLMNTTWRNTIDVGKSDPDRVLCTAPRGDLDYYLFCGPDYRSLLDTYTSLSGRPALLPVWGYALTYVCNENIDAFNMMNEALTFRREGMPCDVIGLEPGWMSKNYDSTTAKRWHPQRFPIPDWAPKGPHTFLGALKRIGFKLSLWLCCDYDLGVYEEECLAGRKPAAATAAHATATAGNVNVQEGFEDAHLTKPSDAKNNHTAKVAAARSSEPWFDHLAYFVDQGVSAFKLDGCAR